MPQHKVGIYEHCSEILALFLAQRIKKGRISEDFSRTESLFILDCQFFESRKRLKTKYALIAMKGEFKFKEPTKVCDTPWVYAKVLERNNPYKTGKLPIEKDIKTFSWLKKLRGKPLAIDLGVIDYETGKHYIDKDLPPFLHLEPGSVGLCRRGNVIEIYFDTNKRTLSLSRENIDKVAVSLNELSGKWLIFRAAREIDNAWKLIWESVRNGVLGDSAKCSTRCKGKPKHVICVYTPNYLCKSDVMRVRKGLHELGLSEILYYKPDIYTELGIYSRIMNFPAYYYRN